MIIGIRISILKKPTHNGRNAFISQIALHSWKSTVITRQTDDKIDSSSSNLCVKCGFHDFPMHSFWYMWSEIQDWISTVLLVKQNFYFQCWKNKISYGMADCVFLPHYWEAHFETPALQTWKDLMNYYLTIEKTMSEDNNKTKQFNETWNNIYRPYMTLRQSWGGGSPVGNTGQRTKCGVCVYLCIIVCML